MTCEHQLHCNPKAFKATSTAGQWCQTHGDTKGCYGDKGHIVFHGIFIENVSRFKWQWTKMPVSHILLVSKLIFLPFRQILDRLHNQLITSLRPLESGCLTLLSKKLSISWPFKIWSAHLNTKQLKILISISGSNTSLCFSQIPRYILTLHELLAHTPHEHVERNSLDYAKSKLEELSR